MNEQGEVTLEPEHLNGTIDLRKTHPGLYRATTVVALACIAQGVNFLVLTPTFPVYGSPFELWSAIFLAVGTVKLVFLNVHRNLHLVRLSMALTITYLAIFGVGTLQPVIAGEGSLQLPILYAALAFLELWYALEPYINPVTAKTE